MSALLTAAALGGEKIIAVDISEEKLEFARSCGAHHALNPQDVNLLEFVQDMTDGGADFCVESAGSTDTIELGFSLIRDGGSLLFASHPPDGQLINLPPHDLIRGKSISGSWGGACLPDRDVPRIAELLKDQIALLQSLLCHRYRLDGINSAIDDLGSGRTFRPLVVMDHPDRATSAA